MFSSKTCRFGLLVVVSFMCIAMVQVPSISNLFLSPSHRQSSFEPHSASEQLQQWSLRVPAARLQPLPHATTTLFVCQTFPLSPAQQLAHLIGLAPAVINSTHHITLYGCGHAPAETDSKSTGGDSLACATATFADTDCRHLLFMWDRGGANYVMPAQYGIPLAAYTHVMMQIHAIDQGQEPAPPQLIGADLTLVQAAHRTPVRWLALYNSLFALKINTKHQSTAMQVLPQELDYILNNGNEKICLVAVHLHMHNSGKQISIEKWRSDEFEANLIQNLNFTGYDSRSQTIFNLNSPVYVDSKDSLVLHCTFNTSLLHRSQDQGRFVRYGVNQGQEMCAVALLINGTQQADRNNWFQPKFI